MTRALAFALTLTLPLAPTAALSDDARVYREQCAVCYGVEGRGDGSAAGMLSPRPRDFTEGRYKFRSDPSSSRPSFEDVARTIRKGLPGTSMPGYADLLAAQEVESLARYVLGLAPPGQRAERVRVSPGPVRGTGRALYAAAGCGQCHGADGRGGRESPQGESAATVRAPTDLTEPWTFRGGSDEASIVSRIMTGIDGSAMPAYATSLSRTEAHEIVRHIRSLARAPIWMERDPARIATAGVAVAKTERGRYLVSAMQCPLVTRRSTPRPGRTTRRMCWPAACA